jgi:hypothetical protein
MITNCDLVAERIALGDPLAELAEHAATCARCRRVAALPGALGASRRRADPGLGFSARITAGAQQRLVVRRRRRVAVGLAGVVAAAAAVVVVVTHQPEPQAVAIDIPQLPQPAVAPAQDRVHREIDPDVKALVHLAHVDRASRVAAHWGRIEKPLAPYKALLEGVKP